MPIVCVRLKGTENESFFGCFRNPSCVMNVLFYLLIQSFLPLIAIALLFSANCHCQDYEMMDDNLFGNYMSTWLFVLYVIGCAGIIIVGNYNYFDPMDTVLVAGQSLSTRNGITTTTSFSSSETDILLYNRNSIRRRGVNKLLVHYIIWNTLFFLPILVYASYLFVVSTPKCKECCSTEDFCDMFFWDF